jgi:hypothetical protein
MYAQFLSIALDQASQSDGTPTTGRALGRLLQCRARLDGPRGESDGSSGTPDALSRELEYDVALITLARLLGLHSDVDSFDQPQKARLRLEQALADHGIRLND